MASENGKTKSNYVGNFIFVCILILLITIGYYFLLTSLDFKTTIQAEHGQFGDLFGGLNALFSGLAFAGVIITIVMQMKELELTRDELKKTSVAQDQSQKALNDQLYHMQATSKIELANSALKIYLDKDEIDKVEITKAIFERMTKNLFENLEYIDILQPKIEFIKCTIHGQDEHLPNYQIKHTPYDINKKNQIKIEFKNIGSNFNFYKNDKQDFKFNLVKVQAGPLSTQRNYIQTSINGGLIQRNVNYILTIDNVLNQESIIIHLKYVGEFIKHEFNQTLKFDIKSKKGNIISPEISEIIYSEIQKSSN